MNAKEIGKIIDNYGVEDIEKHILYKFINYHEISLKESEFFLNYFENFRCSSEIISLITTSSSFDINELAIYLELLIPHQDRNLNGAFFTPSYIADYIISEISPSSSARVIDPSCGCGVFLISAAEYLMKQFSKPLKVVLKENIYGVDILEYNIRRTKLLFVLKGLMIGEIIEESDFKLECNDSLRKDWIEKFDAVIGNPPYVKFQDLDDDNRKYLLLNWTTTKKGAYNLYFPFFELGYRLINNNGKLGYITPNNFFTSLAGESLRYFFQKNANIYKVIDFNSTKVFDVQTYTAITFLNKKKNSKIDYCRIPKNISPFDFIQNIDEIELTSNFYNEINQKKWRLLAGNEGDNIKKIESIGRPLKELFNICVGIATLKDEVYFIDPLSESELYYTFSKNGKSFKVEKAITKPLVKISDFKTQDDIKFNTKRIIFPYKTLGGKYSIIDENEMSTKFPFCYEYLLTVKETLRQRDKGKYIFNPFYAYGRTQGLTKYGIRIYTPTFSQSPRFLIDYNEETMFTNGYALFFNSQELFNNHYLTNPENITVLQKILNSKIMDYYVSKTSVSIDGGYPCYQKNFIENFTIPDLSIQELEFLKNTNDSCEINHFLEKKYHLNLSGPNLNS